MLRHLTATRYVTPLREGGSVPAIVEADDGALYVAKFRGAAQGGRALAAELIVGELARAAGLRVPELALIDVDAALGRSEPHQEIRELLIGSAGINLAMAYLPGALGYDVAARQHVPGDFASAVVALDVFAANVDRTARNPNLLWWRGQLWLIDHGASLYWHHAWDGSMGDDALVTAAARPFAHAADHVLLPFADGIAAAAAATASAIDDEVISRAVTAVPDAWLQGDGSTVCAPPTRYGCARAARPCRASSQRSPVPTRHAFDYVTVQIVPRVDRDERLNVGVILFSPTADYLGCRFALDAGRLRALAPDVDAGAVSRHLEATRAICAGDPDAGPIARLSPSERFHWLSAPRSTVVQPSAAHVGLCDKPEAALDRIFRLTVPFG